MADQIGVLCGIDMSHQQTTTGSYQRKGSGYVFARADQGAGEHLPVQRK